MLRAFAIVALAALVGACAGRPRSVRIATHHPEFASSMACHDRCAAAFSAKLDRAECFAGCPGVAVTRLGCDEPKRWDGVCYETKRGDTPASVSGDMAKIIGFTLLAIAAVGLTIVIVESAHCLDNQLFEECEL